HESGVNPHVLLPVQTGVTEGCFRKCPDRVADAGRDDVIIGLILLKHQPHRAHVVAGEPPVTTGIEVAKAEVIREAELDTSDTVGHLPRHDLHTAPWRLVVEEDARAREHPIAFAIVDRDVVPEHLRYAVWTAWVKRRHLGLRHFAD